MSVIYVAVPPHTTLRLKGRLRCEVLRTEARCVENSMYGSAFWRQPTANSLHAFLVLLMLCKLMLSVLDIRTSWI
jgi:hypothetical protein